MRRLRKLKTESLERRLLLTSLGAVRSGIGVADDATGTGYVLFSDSVVQNRFSPPPVIANSDHLIAARYDNGQWQYNDNEDWYNFNPVATDHLLAEIDFDADTITSFQCISGSVNGINRGFAGDDLEFRANEWNEKFNTGEFTVSGTTFDKTWSECASVLSVTPDSGRPDLTTNAANVVIGGRFDGDPSTLQIRVNNGVPYSTSSTELTTSGSIWSLDLTNENLGAGLPDGDYGVTVSVEGVNNVAEGTVTIDSTPPTATVNSVNDDTGIADLITTDNRIEVSGSYTQGSELEVSFDGVVYELSESPQLTTNGLGTWNLDLTAIPLLGGSYDIEAVATDDAGNVSPVGMASVQIVTATIDRVSDDTGPADFVTSDRQVLLTGTVTPGASITIDINSGGSSFLSGQVPFVSGNNWTLDLTGTTLPLDVYTVVANVTLADNSVPISQQLPHQ